MKIEFDKERWGWSGGWFAVVLALTVDGTRACAVVFGDTLEELFGAERDDPYDMDEAYLRNEAAIDAFIRERLENGHLGKDGYVFVEPEDLAAYFERNNLEREQVSVLV
jgi:hypothetical protein